MDCSETTSIEIALQKELSDKLGFHKPGRCYWIQQTIKERKSMTKTNPNIYSIRILDGVLYYSSYKHFNLNDKIGMIERFQKNYDKLYLKLNDVLMESQIILEYLKQFVKLSRFEEEKLEKEGGKIPIIFPSQILGKVLYFKLSEGQTIIETIYDLMDTLPFSGKFEIKLDEIMKIIDRVMIVALRFANEEPVPDDLKYNEFFCVKAMFHLIKNIAIKKYLKNLFPILSYRRHGNQLRNDKFAESLV